MKKTFIVYTLLIAFANHAFAWRIGPIKGNDPKIPPIGEVVKGVENALPISPRSIKCDQIRDDANRHQSTIRQNLDHVNAHLEMAKNVLEGKNKEKSVLDQRHSYLNKIDALLLEFESINTNLLLNDSRLKGALLNLQYKNSPIALKELLHSMEKDSGNAQARQLAEILHHLMSKNEKEITFLLRHDEGKVLLEQLSVLIGTLKISNFQEKALIDAELTRVNKEISNFEEQKNNLIGQMNQMNAEWHAQEERKSCNF